MASPDSFRFDQFPSTRFRDFLWPVMLNPVTAGGAKDQTMARMQQPQLSVQFDFLQGTKKHPQTALEQQVESMGAHLSAYTSREHTAFYMKTLTKDLPKGEKTNWPHHSFPRSHEMFSDSDRPH